MIDSPRRHQTWHGIRNAIDHSPWTVDVLPGSASADAAEQLGLSDESPLGAVLLHSGGLLIDQGYVRILGGGSAPYHVPDLLHANDLSEYHSASSATAPNLVIGYDVLGGVFVLNGSDPAASSLPGAPGLVNYYPPDRFEWFHTKLTYGQWLRFLLSPHSRDFFLRWDGWHDETRLLRPDQGLSVYPPLWSDQIEALDSASRRPVPMSEIIGMRVDYCQQLNTTAQCPHIQFA